MASGKTGIAALHAHMEEIEAAIRQRETWGPGIAKLICRVKGHVDDLAVHGPGGSIFVCVRCHRRSGSYES